MEGKKKVIENISKILTEKGVLYGATILGADVEHNFFGNKLMSVYNKKGIFSNYSDSADALEKVLSCFFYDVSFYNFLFLAVNNARNKKL